MLCRYSYIRSKMLVVETLVTIGGEFFEVEFTRKEIAPDRDGVYYLFRLRDLLGRGRKDLLISLFRFGPDKLLIPDYESQIERVCLNFIRRSFDDGSVSFDRPNEPHRYQSLTLKSGDFKIRSAVNDDQARQYIIHKAYWIGYKLGSSAKNLVVLFDGESDLEYLGISSSDIGRIVWLLGEQGFLKKSGFPGVGVPTAKLIQDYERGRGEPVAVGQGETNPSNSANLDHLLGIPLRKKLDEDLASLSRESKGRSPLSVLWIDLDNFKPVNDMHGHAAGDSALKAVSSAINAACQGKGQLYRYGGDELIVILPNHSLLEAKAGAERIRDAICKTSFADFSANITASIGVASAPETTPEANLLLAHADAAMYEAKRNGGNGLSVFQMPRTEGSARGDSIPRSVRNDISLGVEAVELWMSLLQGHHLNFILLIENKSDAEVVIESITMKYGAVHLCPPSKPAKLEELYLAAHSRSQISSWSPSVSPSSTLRLMLPDLQIGKTIQIEIVVTGRVLGRQRTFSQTILATVDYTNQAITQYGG